MSVDPILAAARALRAQALAGDPLEREVARAAVYARLAGLAGTREQVRDARALALALADFSVRHHREPADRWGPTREREPAVDHRALRAALDAFHGERVPA
jgi:hypothetical protein